MTESTDKRDYRDTVFLPKTDFPMKAGLPQKEPGILQRWQDEKLYEKLRAARKGRETFILHDGPPYANGDMHIGHALNHILKDMVCRTQSLAGKDAPYVPGWDCHGLPIEWKVEEQYRKKKLNKDEVPAKEFRAECRAYAQHWVDTQSSQLQRLGVNGDWDHPYLTMQFESEAAIVAELLKFAESGQLYRGAKPVMWSPVEKTALAEAEVEYEDIVSTQIDVAFEITESPIEELVGAYAVIWTTTPWTIPVNQALAYGPEVNYAAIRAVDGKIFLIAGELANAFFGRTGIETTAIENGYGWDMVWSGKGSDLAGTVARHPMHHLGGFFAEPRPFLPGDFVTTDSGTGLVHMAPDHGEDDFELCKEHGISPKFVVDAGGVYRDDWLWLGGDDERRRAVINPNFNAPDGPICEDLKEAGALLSASADYQHSYPHSWRSKKKVIFRCTPQWFVPMDKPIAPFDYPVAVPDAIGGALAITTDAKQTATLRETAMKAISETRFVPEKGRNRIGSMVEGRPDWVLSRQRAWGVPITLFVHRETGEYLVDKAVNDRIIAAVRAEGVDAWSDESAQALLGNDYNLDDYERITDILDVWFDSGSTHAFVLESDVWPELSSPADLYLEGSDQHRGWFQSSLLESCATRGRAPYKAVLTHGFTMAADGKKMSKSIGNTVDPLKVMEEYGADIIRLWALSVDFTEDHRIGPEILKGVADQYRKLRNTFRYLLGALSDYDPAEAVEVKDMPELERYMLALLVDLDTKMKRSVEDFDFNAYTRALVDFCNEDLSAFFFDIRKDRLYCDHPEGLERRAYRTVLDTMFQALIRYAAPVLVFTAEEVWRTRYPDGESVHLLEWPEVPHSTTDHHRWRALRELRESVTEAIEPLRREKTIRSGLEAEVVVPASAVPAGFSDADLAELFITGAVTRGDADGVSVTKSSDAKCGRCWRLLPEVSEDGDLCDRCEDVVGKMDAGA
ncbi:isoleucine--tRNA ligase [Alteraurantiacibacter aquimixticola]|uniref:Isoleucine--tRNA ligase n=1 Tax=Alteraurantiacibacter aquimixticola TaxID=2489173 RepID=A0A4T3F035_9SPHN|nr:isoleucine--tRNA ligase [Alteraurantiacibacter aquimixticola]TIX49214.1 isoleucine--tRNA ligase [Alteraurantiacibacter aquimixticola]